MGYDVAPITVVMPVRNRAAMVMRALASVAAQIPQPSHLIVVDNDSSDGTMSVLRDFANARSEGVMRITVVSEKRVGASAARNAGLALADTDWVMFFDSDDLMLPGHIAAAHSAIKNNVHAKIIGWDVLYRDLRGRVCKKPFADSDVMYNCVVHGTMATQRYMARTDLVRSAGGWNENLYAWVDIELGVRLLSHVDASRDILYLRSAPTVQVNATACSITGVSFAAKAGVWERAIDCIEAGLAPADAWIADMKRAVLAGLYRREGAGSLSAELMHILAESSHSRLWRLLVAFTGLGLRGGASIARVFMPKNALI